MMLDSFINRTLQKQIVPKWRVNFNANGKLVKMGDSSCWIPEWVNSLQTYVAFKKVVSSIQCLVLVEMRAGTGLEGGLALAQPLFV